MVFRVYIRVFFFLSANAPVCFVSPLQINKINDNTRQKQTKNQHKLFQASLSQEHLPKQFTTTKEKKTVNPPPKRAVVSENRTREHKPTRDNMELCRAPVGCGVDHRVYS